MLAKNNEPLKIHQQLCVVYFEDFMTESGGRRCCLMLKLVAQTFTMNTELADQVSDWLKKINAKIQENCLFKTTISQNFLPPKNLLFSDFLRYQLTCSLCTDVLIFSLRTCLSLTSSLRAGQIEPLCVRD